MGKLQSIARYLAAVVLCVSCYLLLFQSVARSNEPSEEGFVTLIDRKDTSGWETTGNWGFEPDGDLVLKPTYRRLRLIPDYKSFLWTKKSYGDFILDLEYNVPKDGNSGVFLRSSSHRSYIQAQICDSHGKEGPLDHMDCGAIVDVVAPSKNMAKPAGEWNRMIITCQGNRMQVELNGEEVINLDLDDSQKIKSARSGRIGFENKNSAVAFRNVRIKELGRN